MIFFRFSRVILDKKLLVLELGKEFFKFIIDLFINFGYLISI